MATSKPQTAISYNSIDFLKTTLTRLQEAKLVRHWAFIPHKGEKSENTTSIHPSDHRHLLIIPNKTIDLSDIEAEFTEIVIGEKLPRKLVGLKECKSIEDWVLYVTHDTEYLAMKNEVRQYVYKVEDIVSDNFANIEEWYNKGLKDCFQEVRKIQKLSKIGGAQAVMSGMYSLNQANNIRAFMQMYRDSGGTPHLPDGCMIVDTETGEILSDGNDENVSRETSESKNCQTKKDSGKTKKTPKSDTDDGWIQTDIDWDNL